jgi:hypothetical protein
MLRCFAPWSVQPPTAGVYSGVQGPTATFCIDLILELGGRKQLLELDVSQLKATTTESSSDMAKAMARKKLEEKQAHIQRITDVALTVGVLAKQGDLQWLMPDIHHFSPLELRKMSVDDLLRIADKTIQQLQKESPSNLSPPSAADEEEINGSSSAAAAAPASQ